METFVLVVHVLVAVAMIGLILLQQGKGAEMGASFGAGASQTVFGSAGSASFLTKLTAGLAAVFFVTSLSLAIYARKNAEVVPVLPGLPVQKSEVAPVGDVPAVPASANPDVPVAPAK